MTDKRQLAFHGREYQSRRNLEHSRSLDDEGRFQVLRFEGDWTDVEFEEAIEILDRCYYTPYSVALSLRMKRYEHASAGGFLIRWRDLEEVSK